MALIEMKVTDIELRQLTSEFDNIIVKYTNELCNNCAKLSSTYERLASDKRYDGIKFIKVDSNENPVARVMVEKHNMPFFTIYKKGLALDSAFISNEEGLVKMLEGLVSHNSEVIAQSPA